jgi:tRNA(adenine34) deaminase
MRLALAHAHFALAFGEVPIGCVIVDENGLVAAAHNLRETRQDPTAHAEMLALAEAARRKGTWRLNDCVLVVTLEPCPMCAGAIVNARIGALIFGAADPKAGACSTLYSIPSDRRLNHVLPVVGGVCEKECAALLSNFFRRLRTGRSP